uniref:Uncharacterized protein n=1 Tax=Mucochytrium quahogii TaxID=96639 RepID=A0A7S2RB88_9STRA|mmetsp:Transcript_33175/g.53376  ORF Transcript_33175/g.53376 Transcript_33175/m.53376 type:complete len:953 (-) Transcript_33175:1679-4537(-)
MEDSFLHVLDRMGTRLKGGLNSNGIDETCGVICAGFCPRDEMVVGLSEAEVMEKEIERYKLQCEMRIKRLEKSHEQVLRIRKTRIEDYKARVRLFDAKVGSAMARQKIRKASFERRLRQQYETATRRLQELVFECLGETEKTLERMKIGVEYKIQESIKDRERTVNQLRWNLFLQRLEEDALGAFSVQDISPVKNSQKFELVANKHCKENLVHFNTTDEAFQVERLCSVSYNSKRAESSDTSIVKHVRLTNSAGGCNKPRRPAVCAGTMLQMTDVLGALFADSGIRYLASDQGEDDEQVVVLQKSKSLSSVGNGEGTWGSKQKGRLTMGFQRRIRKGTQRLPLYNADMYLSSQSICWLLWPQHGRAPVDARVYYCIEERGNTSSKEGQCLVDIYKAVHYPQKAFDRCMEACSSSNEWPTGFRVEKYEGRHRHHYSLERFDSNDPVGEGLRNCPDVVVASTGGETIHFATANIGHLLETKRFMELNTKQLSAQDRALLRQTYGNVQQNTLPNLYVVLAASPAKVSALNGLETCVDDSSLQIVPIPNAAIDELITLFIARTNQDPNTSIKLLESSCKHAVMFPRNLEADLQKPIKQQQEKASRKSKPLHKRHLKHQPHEKAPPPTPQGCNAIIASYRRSEEAVATVNGLQAQDVLTRLCLWRACNCVREPNNLNGVCGYHQRFIDALQVTDSGQSEIKRHIPRQSLDTLKKKTDLASITKASSLISELLTNKLSSTVNGFCSRAANAAKPKRKNSSTAKPIRTAQERFRIGTARKSSLEIDIDLASKVRAAEQQVVTELEKFAEIGVFPADSLVAIRQEYHTLDQERDSLFKMEDLGGDKKQPRLFRSRIRFLEKEYSRLVGDDEELKSPNNGDDDDDDEGDLTIRRERHHIEAELELEFCLRKISILRNKRESIQNSDSRNQFTVSSQKEIMKSKAPAIPYSKKKRSVKRYGI